jgi:zinc protease
MEQARTEPQALAPIELARTLYPHPRGDVRATTTVDEAIEDVNRVTLADARAFYDQFVGASNMEFAAVGDFEAPAVAALIEELFGSWSSPAPYSRVTDPYTPIAPVTRTIETPDKQNAMFTAGLRMHLGQNDPDFPAMVLANFMLGGGFINSRLATRIRQRDGLSYGISSSLSASPEVSDGAFRVTAIAAPENVDRVEAAVKEELERAVRDGFSDEEVAAAKSGWLQSRTVARSSDGSLASTLVTRDHDGRTMTSWDEDFERKVEALTPTGILDALRRHLDVDALSIVKAGDFAGVGQ